MADILVYSEKRRDRPRAGRRREGARRGPRPRRDRRGLGPGRRSRGERARRRRRRPRVRERGRRLRGLAGRRRGRRPCADRRAGRRDRRAASAPRGAARRRRRAWRRSSAPAASPTSTRSWPRAASWSPRATPSAAPPWRARRSTTPVKVFAVMPKTFSAEGATAGAGGGRRPVSPSSSAVKVVDRRAKEGDHVNLDAAPLIVGVGRGFNAREDLALGDELAAALGAVVGCTKSLADFEWLGEDRIIGLSGAKTAPDLYLGVGVSGQIQHTVGVGRRQADRRRQQGQGGADLRHGRLRPGRRPLRGGAGARRAPEERVTRAGVRRARRRRIARRRPSHASCSGGETAPPERPGRGRLAAPALLAPEPTGAVPAARISAFFGLGLRPALGRRLRDQRLASARAARECRSAMRSPASTQPAEVSGIASSTPTIPPSAAPISAAMKTISGLSDTVLLYTMFCSTLFSNCW